MQPELPSYCLLETITRDPTVEWLLQSEDPSVRYLCLTEVLGRPEDSEEVKTAKRKILLGPKVKALLSGQKSNGGFGVHPYQKWTGAHWRLVSLVELGIPLGYEPAVKATELVLDWLLGESHLGNVPEINGRYRRCASQEGNALAVCSKLGLARDPRVKKLAQFLNGWQWEDGGWNCDRKPEAHHSSFNESLSTLWGVTEYHRATKDKEIRKTMDRAAEFFLKHRIFKSCRGDGERPPETFHGEMFRMIHKTTSLHYPLYWHYDILQALVILKRAGKLGDPRAREAMDLLESKRQESGSWKPEGYYWSLKRNFKSKIAASNVEVVDWGRRGPNEMITVNALSVLRAAGRLN